jgi:polyhydroxyalkanoate synthesis regulator phasin
MKNVKRLSLKTFPLPEKVATSLEDALAVATEKVEVLTGDARTMATRVKKQVRSAAGRLNHDVDKARRDAARMAEDVSRKVGDTVETFVSEALHHFNVPTRKELKDLTAKVDVLGRKIDGLRATRRVRGPVKRTRRAA